MMKSWICMWKNTFNFTKTTTRKDYWQGLIMNLIAMYIGVIPYALILKNFSRNVPVIMTVYLIAVHLPALSIYFRRAKDAAWKFFDALYYAVTMPAISAFFVGAVHRRSNKNSFFHKMLALGYALFFYGGILGLILNGDPISIPAIPIAGLLLASLTLIVYAITHWREILAILGGYAEH